MADEFRRDMTNSTARSTNLVIDADIREIKHPVPIADPFGWVLAGLLVAAAALLALTGVWLWRRRRKVALQPLPVPPHIRARNRLDRALARIHEPREFCIEVSDALRVYLEEQFELRAPERTTEEFLDEIRSSPGLSAEHQQDLAGFLAQCDLVKFARHEPHEDRLRELHRLAVRLVADTAPPSSPGPDGAGQSRTGAEGGPT